MEELRQISAGIARLEERTKSIETLVREHKGDLETHEGNDRKEFAVIHHRITRTDRKVAWGFGVGAGIMAVVGVLVTFLKEGLTRGP